MRRRPRKDANHSEIVQAALACGLSVLDMAALGNGAPDILLGYGGLCIAAEIKDGTKPPSARKLTPEEQGFKETWRGGLLLVQSVEDVLRAKYILQNWATAIRGINGP